MKNNYDNRNMTGTLKRIKEQFNQCSPLLLALGDTVRQDILMILSERLDTGMNVTDITARTNLSRPAVSHHLKILKNAGFLDSKKERTQVYYFITMREPFAKLKDLIMQLDSIEAKIELQHPRAAANKRR